MNLPTRAADAVATSVLIVAWATLACGPGAPGAGTDGGGAANDSGPIRPDAFVAPECEAPQERLLWQHLSSGPDHVRRILGIGDLDGDATRDVVALVDDRNMTLGDKEVNYLMALGGAGTGTASELWNVAPRIDDSRRESGWGHTSIAPGGDLNDDGIPDVLFAGAKQNKAAFAVDGATGATLWSLDTKLYDDGGLGGPVSDIDAVADITGDGVSEVALVAGSDSNPDANQVYLVDGASGELLWRHSGLGTIQQVESIPDVSGDGIADVVYSTGMGAVEALSGSGSDGGTQSLWVYQTGNINWTLAVVDTGSGDDVNGSSQANPDVVVGSWDHVVRRIDGHSGDLVWDTPIETGVTIHIVARLDDVSGDGIDDLVVTSDDPGAVTVLDGADGAVLWKGQETDASWGVTGTRDLDGDGVGDVVTASADTLVRVYSGATGTLLFDFDAGDERAMTVAAIGDVTGDGIDEIAAGTQYRNTGAGGGTVFLIDGCP